MFEFRKIDSIPSVLGEDTLFMHSDAWTKFQRALGRNVECIGIFQNEEPVGFIYIENNHRKLAKYAYAPFGPVIKKEYLKVEFFLQLNKFMRSYIEQHQLNVFRFDPFKWDVYLEGDLIRAGFEKTMAAVGPKYMWEINLQETEDQLLAGMKKVARYNIKQSEKAGIEIVQASKQENKDELVKEFYKILEETTKRQGFSSFDWLYFQKQSEIIGLGQGCELFLAKYNGQFVSGAWVNFSEDTVSYTHGGSIPNPEIQKFGASYLLHWTIIKHSKSLGKKFYNMWGVVPDGVEAPLKGVSDFKKRFGGKLLENIGGFETTNNVVNKYINRLYDLWVYRKDRV